MDLHDHLHVMAGYHAWAYRRLYAEVDMLDEATYRARNGLFFAGIHGTLNHLLVAERIWRERLEGLPQTLRALDQELYADRTELRAALLASADRWLGHVDALDPAAIAGDFEYRSLKGDPFVLPRATVLLHVFNHATHHRGQVSAALTAAGFEAPAMDMPYYLWERPRSEWRATSQAR